MAEVETESEGVRVSEEVRKCEVSRQQRRTVAEVMRLWKERGSQSGERARYNKIESHLDRVASYLYAPDTVRFGVHLPPAVREAWLPASEMARDEFRERWRDSKSDLAICMLIEWALVYNSTVAKVQHDPGPGFTTGYIQPWDFGVGREDVPELDAQDVMAHWYTLSLPQIDRWLHDDPRRERLLAIAREHQRTNQSSAGVSGLVVSSIQGIWPNSSVTGGFPGEPNLGMSLTAAAVEEPTVTFVDCWERRLYRRVDPMNRRRKGEVFEDWQVSTMIADSNLLFLQRRNPDLPWVRVSTDHALPAEVPFVMMTPRPLPDYLWGRPEIDNLRGLQQWISEQLIDMNTNIGKQLDPPKFFSGVPDWEEANRSLNTPGGGASSAEPGSKMDKLDFKMGEEPFKFLQLENAMFADVSGIPESIQDPGNIPGGVRSTGQFGQVSDIAAGRIRKMALVIEDPIGSIATKAFHLLQRHETQPFALRDGRTFLLSQLPAGLSLRVDAHSAAPIFRVQTENKAVLLKKTGAIGSEDFVELLDPPNRDELKDKARRIDENKAEFAQKKLAIEQEKAEAKRRK
jgi:hypothetical protein